MQNPVQQTIGLIGGMSWESTAVYYKHINEIVRARHGGLRSADVLLRSVNFETVVTLQKAGKWDEAAQYLSKIGNDLADAGAGCVLICTNTMHLVADEVADSLDVPLINIVDVTGKALSAAGIKRPLLLATRYTMEHGFYCDRLEQNFDIEAMVPDEVDRATVHNVIFDELCCGTVTEASRAAYRAIITKAKAAGADAVILGCTEICMLIGAADTDLPVFDSTLLHATAAVDFAEGLALAAPRAA